jgi:hypothetical protein
MAPPYDGRTGQKRTELPCFFQMAAKFGDKKLALLPPLRASSATIQESNYLGIG